MAKRSYNTFVVVDCKKRTPVLVTSSARKAKAMLRAGVRVEVWSANELVEKIYSKTIRRIDFYVSVEKQYIANKQRAAEMRNRMR